MLSCPRLTVSQFLITGDEPAHAAVAKALDPTCYMNDEPVPPPTYAEESLPLSELCTASNIFSASSAWIVNSPPPPPKSTDPWSTRPPPAAEPPATNPPSSNTSSDGAESDTDNPDLVDDPESSWVWAVFGAGLIMLTLAVVLLIYATCLLTSLANKPSAPQYAAAPPDTSAGANAAQVELVSASDGA